MPVPRALMWLGTPLTELAAQASQYDDEYRPPVVDERDERAVVAAHEEVAERSKGSLQRSLRVRGRRTPRACRLVPTPHIGRAIQALEQAEQVAQATSDKLQQQSTTMRGLHRKVRRRRPHRRPPLGAHAVASTQQSRQVREDAVQAKRSANRMERWWTFW